MRKRVLWPVGPMILVLAFLAVRATASGGAVFFGPTSYRSAADVPAGFYAGGSAVFLEDFEDLSLDGGIIASSGNPAAGFFADSVDADDGAIDGSGQSGRSFGHPGTAFPDFIDFTFTGTLPTAAGLVWTDSIGGTVSFEAYGPGMLLLGRIGPFSLADGATTGQTAEDRFFGVQNAGGILMIRIIDTARNFEVDHVQYGNAPDDPGPAFTGYLAEGATSLFFDTRLALLNPWATAATATFTFSKVGASPVISTVPVPAGTRVTVDPKTISGMATAEFSTKVASDQMLVVDRTMSWDVASAYGAHAETAVTAPALTWYLAEGSTVGGFNLFYLLQNPNGVAATVQVRYLLPSGAPLDKAYTLPANSRTNIWVNHEVFPLRGKALASTDVSAVIAVTNGQPIIVERAMYLDVPGQTFGAGHASAGVTAAATQWFLAEGATGPFFDLFVLVANPNPTAAQVDAAYLLPGGMMVTKTYTIPADSRFNIWVDYEDARLADTAVSTTIRSTNGVPIIVERAMWWPDGGWHEAHNSPGATATGTTWALADGEVGGSRGVDTYVLVANTSSTAGQVRVTVLYENGTSAERTFAVAGNSRFNVDVRTEFPAALGTRFGTIVESLGETPAQIVVERAMYWNAGGQRWSAGTSALATKLR